MKETSKTQSPPYVRYLGWLTSPFPDFDFFFIKSVRRRAAELLKLKPGDRVIDAGCGSGGSFPFLVAEVGPGGEVVGIEISPESTASARRRIEKNGWSNVTVIESPAEDAVLTGTFDGLLMFAAPDVYASDSAWKNLGPYLKPNARVAFFGAKLTRRPGRVILNPVLRTLYRLSFATTPGPDMRPWDAVEA
jgi:SAM-dependent methyltransferase